MRFVPPAKFMSFYSSELAVAFTSGFPPRSDSRQNHITVIVQYHIKTEQVMVELFCFFNIFYNDQYIFQSHRFIFETPQTVFSDILRPAQNG